MKRQTFITAVIILLASPGFLGCKKESAASDPSSLFKNTIWTGEFNNSTGAQPLSMEFKEGGMVTWYDLSGETSGAWKVENGGISVTMSNGNGFKASISNNNKLTDFQSLSGSAATMIHAELNTIAETTLDGTTWTTANLALHFKAGNKVDMNLGPTGSTKYPDISYIYKAKTVRYSVVNDDYRWFIVRTGASTFKGVNMFLPDATLYPFEITKN